MSQQGATVKLKEELTLDFFSKFALQTFVKTKLLTAIHEITL
jgi:hypothetical protein